MLVVLSQRTLVETHHAERRDCLDQEWSRLLAKAGYLPAPLPNAAPDPTAMLDRLLPDAIVLTGGPEPLPGENDASGRNTTEAAMLSWAALRGIPVVAICRGLQAMNVRLGGSVVRVDGHVGQQHRIAATDRTCLVVNSFHDFAITRDRLAGDLEPLLLAEDGTIEAARHRDRPWTGLMWHPERANPAPALQEAILTAALSGLPILPVIHGAQS